MNDYSEEFCQEKIRILQEYVSKGEAVLSNIQDWESLPGILEERDQLIKKLQDLEVHFDQKNGPITYAREQKDQIDGLVKLILDMDQNCIKLIQEEQKKTVRELKNNQQNQKIAGYEINMTPSYGTFLDAKK